MMQILMPSMRGQMRQVVQPHSASLGDAFACFKLDFLERLSDLSNIWTVQTDDLELKKLVYLYLINYAKTQPDLAIMGVNTFVKVKKAIL